MLRCISIVICFLTFLAPSAAFADDPFPTLSIKYPYLQERLHSPHFAVRYTLAIDLNGHDSETRRALEILVADPDPKVANQAFRNYTNTFVVIDKKLCRVEDFGLHRLPLDQLPKDNPSQTLVNYCLGIKQNFHAIVEDDYSAIRPLNPHDADNASQVDSLLIIGIFGNPEDVKALYVFLHSTNPYVLLNAAKSVYRLGDTQPAIQTFKRIAAHPPTTENLFYIIEALHALHEINDPDYPKLLTQALTNFSNIKDIHPGALNDLLLLARETDPSALK